MARSAETADDTAIAPRTVEGLLAAATAETGLEEFGDVHFITGLTALVDALPREAALNAVGDQMVYGGIVRLLSNLKGKIALVTGAGSGMGERFAHTLADAGATVICAARRADRIEHVAASIVKAGGKAIALELDIGSTENVSRVFDRAEKDLGLVNVLVNAAAQLDFGPFPAITDESWNNLVNVNFSGTMRMARAFSERLIKAGKPGAIVNITSVTGMQVMAGIPIYGSIKAAVNQLTKQIARDLFDQNIRCNAIAPGYFHTDMVAGYFETDAGKADIQRLPPKRVGQVHELDGALLLLASDAGSYINGAVLPVDAGQVIQLL